MTRARVLYSEIWAEDGRDERRFSRGAANCVTASAMIAIDGGRSCRGHWTARR